MFAPVVDLTLSDSGDLASAPAAAPLARHELRNRARDLFKSEKDRLLTGLNGVVSPDKVELIRPYQLEFKPRAMRTLGSCNYRDKRICLSRKLVSKGLSLDQVVRTIRHEFAHAAMPKEHHSGKWSAFCLAIGGDGKRCAEGKEISEMIGHKVEVFCPVAGPVSGTGHYFAKRLVKPNRNFLAKVCSKCKRNGVHSRLTYKRVRK